MQIWSGELCGNSIKRLTTNTNWLFNRSCLINDNFTLQMNKRVIFDCHSHTYLCRHAEMVLPRVFHSVANAQNFKGYAFCCHNPFPKNDVTIDYRMYLKDFSTFLSLFHKEREYCAQKYPQLELTLNMEVDYHPQNPVKTEEFIDLCGEFDCLLGSLHFYGATFTVKGQNEKIKFIKNYVKCWKEAVQTNWFQIMSHYDFFKIGFGRDWYESNLDTVVDIMSDGITFLSNHNKNQARDGLQPVSMELSTGGLQYDFEPFLPDAKLVEVMVSNNIPICMSSDAHYSHEVGRQFKDAFELLQKFGVQNLHYYKQKQIQNYSLVDAISSYKNVNQQQIVNQFKGTHSRGEWSIE